MRMETHTYAYTHQGHKQTHPLAHLFCPNTSSISSSLQKFQIPTQGKQEITGAVTSSWSKAN